MKVVWRLDKATVRDVYEALREQPRRRLHDGHDDDEDPGGQGLPHEDSGRSCHVYRPAKPRQQVVGAMVRDFVDRVFDGAASGLLVHLAKDNRLSRTERRPHP